MNINNNITYHLNDHAQWFIDWCKKNYGPKEPKTTVEFDVIDSKDESIKLTSFVLKLNGNHVAYSVTATNSIKLEVPSVSQFTLQVTNVEGYVDGVANSYTATLLNGAHIGLTKKTVGDNAEFKLDWDIQIAYDLDSHMVVKNKANEEIAHVFYGEKDYFDSTTSVSLDVDNVTRQENKPPEIMSITNLNSDYTYYYYVDDYSVTGKLPKSNLNLNVVIRNQTVDPAMTIPSADNPNRCWNVCKIQNGQLVRASSVLAETVTSEPNTSY